MLGVLELAFLSNGAVLFIGQRTTDVTGLAAGAVLISIPVIIVFVVFQRTLIRGILAGALKA